MADDALAAAYPSGYPEQLHDEPAHHYTVFIQWLCQATLATGTRPMKAIALAHDLRLYDVQRAARKYMWRERAAAWDVWRSQVAKGAVETYVRDSVERVGEALGIALDASTEGLLRLGQAIRDDTPAMIAGQPVKVSVEDLRKLMETAVNLGRLVQGMSTENVAVKVEARDLSDAEVIDLDALDAETLLKLRGAL